MPVVTETFIGSPLVGVHNRAIEKITVLQISFKSIGLREIVVIAVVRRPSVVGDYSQRRRRPVEPGRRCVLSSIKHIDQTQRRPHHLMSPLSLMPVKTTLPMF